MKIFHAGFSNPKDQTTALAMRLSTLVSYWDCSRGQYNLGAMRAAEWAGHFLDSGAFSAHNSGAVIDLGAFADFYLAHADLFAVVSNLDVIGDAAASGRNLLGLRARGVPAIPVWHLSSPLGALDAMCSEHKHIAFGGMVPYVKQQALREKMLGRAWDVVFKHWPVKVHGFGLTAPAEMQARPWFSVDSTAAMMGAAFHVARLPHPETGMPKQSKRVPTLRAERLELNIGTMLELERRVTEAWAAKGVVW